MRAVTPLTAVSCGLTLVVWVASASAVSAQTSTSSTSGVSAGSDLVATSHYIWRGFAPVDTFSVQSNLWLKLGDVTVSSWMNTTKRHGPLDAALSEHDLTVDYSKTRGTYTLSAGWINYVFPDLDASRHSNELYIGIAQAGYLNPSIRIYQDVHAGSGTYVNAGVSHTYDLPWRISVSPSIAVGFNHRQWIDDSTFSDLNGGIKLTLPTPVRRLWVAPFFNYSRSLNHDLFDDRAYGGIGVTVK